MTRETIIANPSLRGVYTLCKEQPPAENVQSFRWSIWDIHREALARAFRLGRLDKPGSWAPDSFCAAAWMAGRDAA